MKEAGMLLARAGAYALVARGFAYPTAAMSDRIRDLSFQAELAGALDGAGITTASPALAALERSASQLAVGPITLEEEHTHLFSRRVLCPPYQRSYRYDGAPGNNADLADIGGFYAAFGLQAAVGGELPDHVSVQMEFLGALCAKESFALTRGWTERADTCRDARHKFVKEHPGTWVPRFAARVREHGRLAFYPALADVAELLLALETDMAAVAGKGVQG